MKNREMKLFIITLLVLSVLSLSMVSAIANPTGNNITINIPAVSGTLTGATAVFNITMITGFEAQNWSQVDVWLNSLSTANSSSTFISSGYNLTTILTLNGTLSSTDFEDSNDYTIIFQLRNGSDSFNVSRNSITINNTIPQVPSSLSPSSTTILTSSSTQTFTSTVTNRNTTGCTYTIYRGGSPSDSSSASGSANYLTNTCSFTKSFTSSVDNGNYYWTITASDGSDSSISSPTLFSVQIPASAGGLLPGTYKTEEGKTLTIASNGTIGSSPVLIIGIVVGVVLLIGTAIFIIRKR